MRERVATEGKGHELAVLLGGAPILPVIVIDDARHAVPLGRALAEAGLRTLEITLRTEQALAAIRAMREALPEIRVGAGTVLGVEQYRLAVAHGAQFVVSPGSTVELLEYGMNADVPLLPGVATVSELMQGYRLGYRCFKFFPAEVAGGVAALKAFAGPFPDVRFLPTGGIRQNTAAAYLALPSVLAVGGTWLTPSALLSRGDWEGVTALARQSLVMLG